MSQSFLKMFAKLPPPEGGAAGKELYRMGQDGRGI